MKPSIFLLLFAQFASLSLHAQSSRYQLADPIVTVDSLLFRQAATLEARLDYPDVALRYTVDGSEPTAAAARLTGPLRIDSSQVVRVRAFHPELRPSETASITLLRVPPPPALAWVELKDAAHTSYPGGGAASLFDLQKGGVNFREPVWSGFFGNDLEVNLTLAEAQILTGLTVSTLADPGSWIFPPQSIAVYGGSSLQDLTLIAEKAWPEMTADDPTGLQFPRLRFTPITVRQLRIVVRHAGAIPDWHPGAGTPAWLFLDEILLLR